VGGRGAGRRLLVGLASLTPLAARTSGASPSPPPATPTATAAPSVAVATPTVTPSLATSPTPTASPTAIAFGEATQTESALDCKFFATDPPIQCTTVRNDPRVSGKYAATVHTRPWSADASHEAFVPWGTARLVNAGGVWEGPYSGIFATGRGNIITTWYTGSGGYAGLSYYETITASTTGPGWVAVGLIFPGSPPTG